MAKTEVKQPKEKKVEPINYRPVVFLDTTSDEQFLVNSAVKTTEKITYKDGKEYDLFKVEISSSSHPFYTGKEVTFAKAGRADKFRAKVEGAKKANS